MDIFLKICIYVDCIAVIGRKLILHGCIWFQVLEEKEDKDQIRVSSIPRLTPFHFQGIRIHPPISKPNLLMLRPEPNPFLRELTKQNREALAMPVSTSQEGTQGQGLRYFVGNVSSQKERGND